MCRWVVMLGVFSLVACTVGPDYRRPDLELPSQWNNEVLLSAQEREDLAGWWTYFKDPVLRVLVGRAVARNLNIRLEIARVREARARLGFARAEQFPTIDLQIDAARQQESAGLGGFGGEGSDIDDGLGGEGSEAGGVGGEHISAF
jgi:multidrug efflux system outer membrane protein